MKKGETQIVLLHGFCESGMIWKDFTAQNELPWSCLIPDLAGFGSNHKNIQTLDEMVDDLAENMNGQQVQNAVVIGHSMGGYVALNLARRYPKLVRAIGLFHSNAAPDSDEKKEVRNRSIEHLEQHGPKEFLKIMASNLLAPANRENGALLSQAFNQVKHAHVQGLTAALAAMRDRTSSEEFIRLTNLPILWVIGRHDEFMPAALLLKQASTCQRTMVELMEVSGHLGMMEEPDKALQILTRFIHWVQESDDLSSVSSIT